MNLSTRWRKFWQSNDANAQEELTHWIEHITANDIRSLFLKYFSEGNNLWLPAFQSPEPEYFRKVVVGLDKTPDGQIQLPSIVRYLEQSHPSKINTIQSAASIIENIITAHAHFPFSEPVRLTEDSLCRAILLLTNSCQEPFNQAEGGSRRGVSNEYIRKRPDERRLRFLYSTLLRPNTGIPTQDDVLDVVCRVDYPAVVRGKDRVQRRPVSYFVPLVERLESPTVVEGEDEVPISELNVLHDLVTAFPPRQTESLLDLEFGNQVGVSAEQFIQWATKAHLLESFDQLFSVFLSPVPTEN